VDGACCDCGGCEQDTYLRSNAIGFVCARLYEQTNCSNCYGFRLDVGRFGVRDLAYLDNRLNAARISPGCGLTIYKDKNYLGPRAAFWSSVNDFGVIIVFQGAFSLICNIQSKTFVSRISEILYLPYLATAQTRQYWRIQEAMQFLANLVPFLHMILKIRLITP